MRTILLICIVLGLSPVPAHAQTASEILAKVTAAYATARSYSDEGVSRIDAARTSGRRTIFQTRFARAAGFRFELWFNPDRRGTSWILWKNGDAVTSTGMQFGIGVQNIRFDTALLRMAVTSGGASLTIPQLLLPNDFRTLGLFDLIANAKVSGEEKVDGRRAFIIEGTLLGQPLKLWIDKNQNLILKSYRKVVFGDREEEATIQYKPKLNGEVPPEDLIPRPNQLVGDGVVYQSTQLNSPGPPVLAPRLQKFGSSLGRSPGERAAASGERSATDEDVVRIVTDLVVCTALVVDPQGKIVRGLTKEDFVVKEDDKPQEIASLSMGDNKDLPRSIVLVIDYSGSQLPYIKTSIESAKMLVDKLNPKDRMAVVTDDVKLLVDFTSDKELLKSQLETLKSSALSGKMGASEQYDALLATLNELFDNEDTRPIIIFQTDGDQLDGLKDGLSVGSYSLPRRYGFKDLLTAAEKSRATVYSVISGVKFLNVTEDEVVRRAHLDWDNRQNAGYEMMRARNVPIPKGATVARPDPAPKYFVDYGNQWVRRQTSLVNMAQFTGTLPEFLEEPGQADEIYNRILNDIDRRYVIGYYPTNRARDGKRRKVSIEVKGHPEYTVWGQKSYFAREEK